MRVLVLIITLLVAMVVSGQDFKRALVFERLNQELEKGLVDSLGNIILPAEYGSITVTKDGKFIVASKQKGYRYSDGERYGSIEMKYAHYEYGVLDANLDTILPFEYSVINTYRKPYSVYHDKKGMAIFDDNFKEIIPFQYERLQYISQPYQGYLYTTNDGFSGVINKKGKIIIEEKPFQIEPISKKLFAVKVKRKSYDSDFDTPYYLFDENLNKMSDLSFYYFRFLTPNVILFDSGNNGNSNKMGLMNTKGTVLLPAEYMQISYDELNKVYLIRKSQYGKFGMLDSDLKTILPFEYTEIKMGKKTSLYMISKDKKYGFSNNKGEIIIDVIYDGADVFSEGLAPVLKEGKWGFINEKGKVVIDFQFVGGMKTFENGYATFYQDQKSSNYKMPTSLTKSVFINKKGQMIGEPEVGDIRYYSRDKAIRYDRNKYENLVDLKTGEILFELEQKRP